jgi:uncharacterized membrane protein YkoI
MSQRLAFVIAAALTAFVLVLGGAVAGQISRLPESGTASTEPVSTENAGSPSFDLASDMQKTADLSPDIKVLLDREIAYQQLIKQANDRLQSIYSGAQSDLGSPAVALNPVDAATIALNASPGEIMTELPNLVNFQGKAAYEITLANGIVYVDANTGEILYNSIIAAPPVIIPSPPPFLGSNTKSDGSMNLKDSVRGDIDRETGGGEQETHEGGDD